MKKFRELLEEYLIENSINQKVAAMKLGISQQAVSGLLTNVSEVRPSTKKKVFKAFPEFEQHLQDKQDNNLSSKKTKDIIKDKRKLLFQNELTEVSIKYMRVPLISVKAQAGFPTGFGDELYMDELDTVLWEIDDKEYKGGYIVFEVAGDSMDDGTKKSLEDGDKILCREVASHLWQYKLHYKQWNFVLSHPEDGVTVKRITDHNVETGIIKCHSLNEYYEDFDLNINELSAIFNVVDIKRSARI